MPDLFKGISLATPRSGGPAAAAAGNATEKGPPYKRQRPQAPPLDVDKDWEVLRKVANLACVSAAKIRTLENFCYFTWILSATAPIFVILLDTGHAYSEAARKDKNHAMGSPHISLAAALINYIVEASSTPQPDKEALTEFTKRHKSATEIGQSIPVVRKSYTYQNKSARVVIGLDPQAITDGIGEILKRAFLAEGAEMKTGDAPKGPLERDIAAHFSFGPDSRDS